MSRAWVKVPYKLIAATDVLILTGEEWDAIASLPEQNEDGDDERQEALAELAKASMTPSDFCFYTDQVVHVEGPS
jgi:hypothetical protein